MRVSAHCDRSGLTSVSPLLSPWQVCTSGKMWLFALCCLPPLLQPRTAAARSTRPAQTFVSLLFPFPENSARRVSAFPDSASVKNDEREIRLLRRTRAAKTRVAMSIDPASGDSFHDHLRDGVILAPFPSQVKHGAHPIKNQGYNLIIASAC